MYSFLYLFRLSPQFTPFAYLKELKIGWEISSPRVFNPFPLTHLAWLHSISPRTLQFEVLSLRLSRPCPFPLLPLAILQKSFGALFPPARRFSFFCFSSSGAVVQCTWWCSISLDGFPSTPSVRFSLCFHPGFSTSFLAWKIFTSCWQLQRFWWWQRQVVAFCVFLLWLLWHLCKMLHSQLIFSKGNPCKEYCCWLCYFTSDQMLAKLLSKWTRQSITIQFDTSLLDLNMQLWSLEMNMWVKNIRFGWREKAWFLLPFDTDLVLFRDIRMTIKAI